MPGKTREEFVVYWEKLVDLCGRLVTMDESVLEERDWFEERKEMIEIVIHIGEAKVVRYGGR